MKKHAFFEWTRWVPITAVAIGLGLSTNTALGADPAPPATPTGATTIAAPVPALPYGVSEVLKLYQGGISKEVLINYINSNYGSFHLNADGIIYLQRLGLPQDVLTAMMKRDAELQQQQGAAYQAQQAQAAQASMMAGQPVAAASPVVVPSSPAPQVAYPYPPATTYASPDYDYPYYDYGYPYYPGVVVGGFGWGWPGWGGGFGYGGFHGGFGGRGGFGGHGGFGGRGGFGGGHR